MEHPLIDQFLALPKEERNQIAKRAFKTVEECIAEFTSALLATEASPETRALVMDEVWGWRPDLTIEQALDDNSKFSRQYDLAVQAAIIVEMQERNNKQERN